jgi:hypothetical protein
MNDGKYYFFLIQNFTHEALYSRSIRGNITPSKLPSDCIADPRVPGLSPPFAVIKVNYLLEG